MSATSPGVFPPPTLGSATGWAFCAVLGGLLLSLLVMPPAGRVPPAFEFPAGMPVKGPGHTTGKLAGTAVDIVGAGGWHLPATFRYRYLPTGATAAEDVEVLVTYMVSPRADARQVPELYATRPWAPAETPDNTWTSRAIQHSDAAGPSWLEVKDWQGVYLATRIGQDGRCTSTAEQVSRNQFAAWRQRPWTVLSWPFSAKPEADQRAVWVRMTVNRRVDGTPRSPEEIEGLWRGMLSAVSTQVRASLQRR